MSMSYAQLKLQIAIVMLYNALQLKLYIVVHAHACIVWEHKTLLFGSYYSYQGSVWGSYVATPYLQNNFEIYSPMKVFPMQSSLWTLLWKDMLLENLKETI